MWNEKLLSFWYRTCRLSPTVRLAIRDLPLDVACLSFINLHLPNLHRSPINHRQSTSCPSTTDLLTSPGLSFAACTLRPPCHPYSSCYCSPWRASDRNLSGRTSSMVSAELSSLTREDEGPPFTRLPAPCASVVSQLVMLIHHLADGLSKASKTVVFMMSIAAFDEVSRGLTVDVTVGLECDCHG